MLQYFKEAFTTYKYAGVLQTVSLIMFIVFFSLLVYVLWKRPKDYYKEVSELPLEDGENI